MKKNFFQTLLFLSRTMFIARVFESQRNFFEVRFFASPRFFFSVSDLVLMKSYENHDRSEI